MTTSGAIRLLQMVTITGIPLGLYFLVTSKPDFLSTRPVEVIVSDYNNSKSIKFKLALKNMGIESADDHEFKSHYIITPRVYDQNIGVKKPPGKRKTKIISFHEIRHNKWVKDASIFTYNNDFKKCPYNECLLDGNGKMQSKADMVWFVCGGMRNMPKHRPAGQLWAAACWESPAHWNYPDNSWKSVFNLTVGYRTDLDIGFIHDYLSWRDSSLLLKHEDYGFTHVRSTRVSMPYINNNNSNLKWSILGRQWCDMGVGVPGCREPMNFEADHGDEAAATNSPVSIAKKKTKTAAWMVSHCDTPSKRQEYVTEMQKYIDVDIYGKCGPLNCPKSQQEKCQQMWNTTYKFYLGFENSLCLDYATYKVFGVFQQRRHHVIPVVRGGFDYDKYFPKDVLINTNKFKSAKELALYLKDLANDTERYAKMLREKDKLIIRPENLDWCDVCEGLHTGKFLGRVIPDVSKITHKPGVCWSPTDLK